MRQYFPESGTYVYTIFFNNNLSTFPSLNNHLKLINHSITHTIFRSPNKIFHLLNRSRNLHLLNNTLNLPLNQFSIQSITVINEPTQFTTRSTTHFILFTQLPTNFITHPIYRQPTQLTILHFPNQYFQSISKYYFQNSK